MNNDLMFSSKTDMWATPQKLFDKLDAVFRFNTDVCATAENAKGMLKFGAAENNAPFPSAIVVFRPSLIDAFI